MSIAGDQFQPEKKMVNCCFLLLWIVVGSVLRFANLEDKTVWSDEWSTIVFSLGHSFRDLPLDRVIDSATVLELLRVDASRHAVDTIAHLMTESTHPPLYFVLSHWWLKLFAGDGDLVSIWHARSLSAILGVVAIPAMFGLGWLIFESLLVAQFAAVLMAVSPYGIYLAQEARHYTLAILWVIASLACWVVTIRNWSRQQVPRRSLMLIWTVINSLGMATHYFFGLNLLAQAMVLLTLWWRDLKTNWGRVPSPVTQFWRRISLAIWGTIAGSAIWVVSWLNFPHERLTSWTHQDYDFGLELLFPLGRLLAWVVTMFVLPPVEGVLTWIIIVSAILLLPILFWFGKAGWQYLQTPAAVVETAIARFVGIALALNLIFAYIIGRDLTLAARFQYFYFPAILLLGAGILAHQWQSNPKRGTIILTLAIVLSGCIGGVVIVNNYGFQKSDRPDLVVPAIAEAHQNIPTVIATVYRTHGQAVETIGLNWEWQQYPTQDSTLQFLLLSVADDYRTPTSNLYRFLEQFPRPFELWLVNFSASTILKYHSLNSQGCLANPDVRQRRSGYRAEYYYCQKKPDNARKNNY